MKNEGEQAGASTSGTPIDRRRVPVVYVCDLSPEGKRIADTLRVAGYVLVEVPPEELRGVGTASLPRPNVLLVDGNANNAIEAIASLRKLPGFASMDVVCLVDDDHDAGSALPEDPAACFVRPVDVAALVRKIEALTGGPTPRPEARPSPLPPSLSPLSSLASSRGWRPSEVPPEDDEAPQAPLRLREAKGPPLPMSTTSLADLVDAPRPLATLGTLSEELQQRLADAEVRAARFAADDRVEIATPEEEIETVLPADILASLDEQLEGDEEDSAAALDARVGLPTPADRDSAGVPLKQTTSGGRQQTTGAGARVVGAGTRLQHASEPVRVPSQYPSEAPRLVAPHIEAGERAQAFPTVGLVKAVRANDTFSPIPPPEPVGDVRPESVWDMQEAPAPRPLSWYPPPAIASVPPPVPSVVPSVNTDERVHEFATADTPEKGEAVVVLDAVDARRFFAEAIARRATGALCFECDGVTRRVVLRDGDLVAAASEGTDETLVHFLVERGELPREEAAGLALKLPPFGRYAGAALVAHGWLRQDQLWHVLRAHAEWIAAAVLRVRRGSAKLEAEPPGRLRGEPSVFGAATGASIFVELVRRAVPSVDALAKLGGPASRMADGPAYALLAECNLPPHDLDLLSRARGGTLRDVFARSGDGEMPAVLHALSLLGIVTIVKAPSFGSADLSGRVDPEVAAIDDDAVRGRIRARLSLVEEGDYFSVLGVTRDATSYEVRRAFVDLRRTFEPSRILTPRLLDLADDVRKIVLVLEEAYEILRDSARRERYRRAIDARPE
jgi:hypothetical protein